MISTNLYDTKGKVTGKVDLPEEFFGVKVNTVLLTQAVRIYLSNQRRSRAKAKTRSEVNRTSAKWFRQKGTGRARHGARSAPIFVGGGVAHGPTGGENWKKTMPKKLRRQALASALTSKFKDKEMVVIADLDKIKGKTKEIAGILNALSDKKEKEREKFLLILPKNSDLLVRASRNIPKLMVAQINSLTAYEVLNGGKILVTPQTLEVLRK